MFISTILLYQGLSATLVFWKISLEIFGTSLTVIDDNRTFSGMMQQMTHEEAMLPVMFLVFFGFVLPLIKIVLFTMWVWDGVGGGDKYIRYVKGLSKWTGVDAVVEALVVGMLLKIPGADAAHGYGFTCFVGYVLLSTIAFCCLPGEVHFAEEPPNAFHMKVCEKFRSPRVRKATLAVSLTTFLVVLSFGLSVHTMRLWIPKDTLQWNIGHRLLNREALPEPLRSLSDPMMQRIEEAVARLVDLTADTSVSGCIRRLMQSNSWYTVAGSLALFICVIVIPVAYAVINTAYALALTELPEEELKGLTDATNRGEEAAPWPAMSRLRAFLWDLSLLDVCAVAFPIATGAISYRNDLQGEMLDGYALIFLAALSWHVQNFLCRCAQLSVLTTLDGHFLLEPGAEPAAETRSSPAPIYI